jgi:hypothetical protein
MTAIRQVALAALLGLAATSAGRADKMSPDSVMLKNGTVLRGLILKDGRDELIIQTRDGESRIPKDYIRRIDDAPDDGVIFDGLVGRDELPSWRAIVHDLRTHDSIRSFEQIPPTKIDNGLLRNIPYLSFRINQHAELNVYGDPQNPVAVEFGMFGSKGRKKEKRRIFGEFIAGHLHSREQIAALYSLGPDNREARAGRLGFRMIKPPDPDSYGAKWVVVYRTDRLESARLSDNQYAELTRPFDEVNHRDGSLRRGERDNLGDWLDRMTRRLTGRGNEMRGFYRDKNGIFRVITSDGES